MPLRGRQLVVLPPSQRDKQADGHGRTDGRTDRRTDRSVAYDPTVGREHNNVYMRYHYAVWNNDINTTQRCNECNKYLAILTENS